MISIILDTAWLRPETAATLMKQISQVPSCTAAAVQGDGVREALMRGAGDKTLVLRPDQNADLDQLIDLIATALGTGAETIAYAPLQLGEEIIDLGLPTADNVVDLLTSPAAWPAAAFTVPAELMAELRFDTRITATEIFAALLVKALSANMSIEKLSQVLALDAARTPDMRLQPEAQARLLSAAVNSFNIEELFPHHAWSDHSEESAAASYHTLAAIFLRLGDLSAAEQCLSFSDRLEDSPRSLALKAIIANASGEKLGAVANMVSSLQQYERRKNNRSSQHYLSFNPRDLEAVNDKLQAGLSALNRRDNSAAFQYFAAAVSNFDSFYSETGIDRLMQ